MRNVLAHAYFGVDLPTVWRTIQDDLPLLKARLREVLRLPPADDEIYPPLRSAAAPPSNFV